MQHRKFLLAAAFLGAWCFWANEPCTAQTATDGYPFCRVSPSPDATLVYDAVGVALSVFVKGTADLHYLETTDGYTVLKANDGFYKYAKQTANGSLVPGGTVAHDAANRTPQEWAFLATAAKHLRYTGAALQGKLAVIQTAKGITTTPSGVFPSTGTRKALLILIDFPDQLGTFSNNNFVNLTNQTGYNVNGQTGSFKDYYLDASNGLLNITTTVKGWYTASGNRATYGDAAGSAAARPLVRQAVDAAEAAGVNFSQFDGDNDGKVDVVMIIHSGRGAEESGDDDDIWSHRWVLGSSYQVTYDGVLVSDYIIQPEKYSSANTITNIGVLCHEFGHALGLPDLYDTDYSSSGVGKWCLMAGGSWNNSGKTPPHMSAWCKDQLNWINPTVLTGSGNVSNMNYVGNGAEYYRFNTPDSDEYFLLENRQKTGWDAYLPGEGLAIWHVDDSQGSNSNENRKWVDLEEADGLGELDAGSNSGNAGDLYPGSANATVFNASSNPNSNIYSGAASGVAVSGVSESGTTVSFSYGGAVVVTPPCNALVSAFPYSESFETGLGAWSQASTDDMDWTQLSGATSSISTGPDAAQDGSYYLYTEASSPNYPSKTAILNGPCFNLKANATGNFNLSFYYHLYGAAMGTLSLQVSTDGNNWTTLWTKSGDQGNIWSLATVNLATYANDTLRTRFVGITGSSYDSDMAIDNLKLGTSTTTTNSGETCNTAIELTSTGTYVSNGPTTGNGATQANATHADWYKFIVPTSGMLEISACNGGADTRLWVYDGSCGSLTLLAQNDDHCQYTAGSNSYASFLSLAVNANDVLYLEWDDRWDGSGFAFNLDIIVPQTTGDNCNNASLIQQNGTYLTDGPSTGYGATQTDATHADWWKFTAPANGTINVSSCGYGADTRLWIRQGTCNALNLLDYNDDACLMGSFSADAYASSLAGVPVVAGTTYYIEWDDHWSSIAFSFDFNFTPSALPCSLVATLTAANATCYGSSDGSILASAAGGTTPYTYAWNNGATSPQITNLAAGSYTCIVTDAAGCTDSVSIMVASPTAIVVTPVVTHPACSTSKNGKITLSTTGGVSPYTYAWSNGKTTANLATLVAGNYTCTVTDAAGCTTVQTVAVTAPPLLEADGEITDASCDASGSIDLAVQGGVLPYSFSWSNGSTAEDLFGVAKGTFTANITDAQGCSVKFIGKVNQLEAEVFALPNTATKVFFAWHPFAGATGYRVRVREVGVTTWKQYTFTANTFNSIKDGFLAGKTYEYAIQATCATTTPVWTTAKQFTMPNSPSACAAPSSTWSTVGAAGSVSVYWSYVAGAKSYLFRYRQLGTTAWTKATNVSSQRTFTVAQGATYEYQIATKCSDNSITSYSPLFYFFVPAAAPQAVDAPQPTDQPTFVAYPNPTADALYVEMPTAEAFTRLEVVDLLGRVLLTKTVQQNREVLWVNDLSAGSYFVVGSTAKGQRIAKLFVKQ